MAAEGMYMPYIAMICKMYELFNTLKAYMPYIAMITLQFGYAGMPIITMTAFKHGIMTAFKHGMSHWILVFYRQLVAAIMTAPLAYFIERKNGAKMTVSIFLKIKILAILESLLNQNFFYVGMQSTSATYASAIVNVLPAITFIMAIIFRLEKVNIKKINSISHIVGSLFTALGGIGEAQQTAHHIPNNHMVKGTIMLLASIVGWSCFFIVQAKTLEEYPAPLCLTTFVSMIGTLESGIAALIMERRHMSAWAIGFDSRLLAAVYAGIVCSEIAYYMQGLVNKIRGPVFVTTFSPLSMVIAAVLGAIVLSEQINLQNLIGAIIIVIGLYSVIWGKSKDLPVSNTSEKTKSYELPVTIVK